MNYGIVGTNIYSDIVQGATQMMGIVQQGRRDVADAEFKREGLDFQREQFEADAEFKREGLDFQREQFEADQTQRGISNEQADRRHELAQDQFDQSKIDSWVNNTIKGMEYGLSAPTDMKGLEGVPNAGEIVSKTQQIGNQVQVVDALQQTLDIAYTTGEGKTFNQQSVDRLTPALEKSLNPGSKNPDFKLEGTLNDNGTISYAVDEATYEALDEQSKGIFSMIGASAPSREEMEASMAGADHPANGIEITPDMLSTHLSQEIGELNNLGRHGQAQAGQKMNTFSKNEATSPQAKLLAVRKQKTASGASAYSKTTRANERISRMATTWIRNGDGVDPAAASKAETEAQAEVNEAYAEYQTGLETANTFDEISAVNRAYNTRVTKASADFATRAGDALQWSEYERSVVSASDTGALNQKAYSKQGKLGWSYTKAQAKEATEILIPKMTAQLDAEARAPFLDVEVKRLRNANPSLSEGDALDKANETFDEKRQAFQKDATLAAVDGKPIAADSYQFMMTYAKPMLRTLQINNASSYLPRKDDAETVKNSEDDIMANSY